MEPQGITEAWILCLHNKMEDKKKVKLRIQNILGVVKGDDSLELDDSLVLVWVLQRLNFPKCYRLVMKRKQDNKPTRCFNAYKLHDTILRGRQQLSY